MDIFSRIEDFISENESQKENGDVVNDFAGVSFVYFKNLKRRTATETGRLPAHTSCTSKESQKENSD